MKLTVLARNWLVAVVLAATAIIYFSPAPPPAVPPTNLEVGWRVPRAAPKADLRRQAASLTLSNLWGGQFAPPIVDTTYDTWRLVGTSNSGGLKQVLVLQGPDRIIHLKVGELLPDGTKIAEIRNTGICIFLFGKKRFLPLPEQAVPLVW